MPSLYTNTGIELIADGEQTGLWGDTTNTNLQILNRLTSEAGVITLAGTTHTLTLTAGDLSEGQYAALIFSGSPTGTNTVTISPNTARRVYAIKNTSGETVVLTQGTGGNVSIADGEEAVVYCDGAGSVAAVVDITTTYLRSSNNLSDLADAPTALTNLGITSTAAELNKLDGATLDIAAVTAVAAEVNVLDGITATTAELNILDGVTATTAELNLLDGVTATTAELNLLDGATLDVSAVTATAAEVNVLDGVTATTTELNYTDGVTSNIQTQLDAKYEADTQAEAAWEAGTSTTESLVSPAKVKAASLANGVKSWVNFNGTGTIAIRDSFNVSSLTDNGTGNYTVNFSTSMANVGYTPLVTSKDTGGTWPVLSGATDPTTSGCSCYHRGTSSTGDTSIYGVSVSGDLA